MRVNKSNIRRCAKRYLNWLLEQQWFNLNVTNKISWLEPLEDIITKKSDSPEALWESVIDHWQATPWEHDKCPKIFTELYDLIDSYRNLHLVSSTVNA